MKKLYTLWKIGTLLYCTQTYTMQESKYETYQKSLQDKYPDNIDQQLQVALHDYAVKKVARSCENAPSNIDLIKNNRKNMTENLFPDNKKEQLQHYINLVIKYM